MRVSVFFGLVAFMLVPQESLARDLAAYFPSETGRTWRYSTTKQSTLTVGPESRRTEKRGTVAEEVRSASDLGTVAIRRIVTEENSTMGQVRVESVLHVRVAPDSIAVSAIEAPAQQPVQRLSPHQPLLLQEVPGPVIEGAQGSLRLSTQLSSQSSSGTEVPLGEFSDCLLTEAKGSVSGSLNGVPVQTGEIVVKAWYARGVGLVREERTLSFTVSAPNGASIDVREVATKLLEESASQ